MTRIVWTRPALEDVREIRNHIAQDSPRYARVVAGRIVGAVRRLHDDPMSGRVVPELARATIREVIYGTYRIVPHHSGRGGDSYRGPRGAPFPRQPAVGPQIAAG